MGQVYKARERFQREARAASALSHPRCPVGSVCRPDGGPRGSWPRAGKWARETSKLTPSYHLDRGHVSMLRAEIELKRNQPAMVFRLRGRARAALRRHSKSQESLSGLPGDLPILAEARKEHAALQ